MALGRAAKWSLFKVKVQLFPFSCCRPALITSRAQLYAIISSTQWASQTYVHIAKVPIAISFIVYGVFTIEDTRLDRNF
jgi:hypothetical protein